MFHVGYPLKEEKYDKSKMSIIWKPQMSLNDRRQYYKEHSQKWRNANIKRNREIQKKYYWTHREAELKRSKIKWKKRYKKDRDNLLIRFALWKKKNPEKTIQHGRNRRARELEADGMFTVLEWEELKKKLNYTCQMCKKKEPIIKLTADHIIPLSKRGTHYINNIQPLCRPCNSTKGTN